VRTFVCGARRGVSLKKALAPLAFALAFALTPPVAHAEFQLGAVGMYNGDIMALGTQPLDMTWGMESRLKFLNVFQIGLTGLYYPPSVVGGSSYILALTDAGLSVDIFFLRFGVGIGPNFLIPMSGPSVSVTSNANLKLSGDINIGPVSLGVVAFYPVMSIWDLQGIAGMKPWLGLTAMIKLF
jgi:hypothetical protein